MYAEGFHLAECIIFALAGFLGALLICHRHRVTIARRALVLYGSLLGLRGLTITATTLPVPHTSLPGAATPDAGLLDLLHLTISIYGQGGLATKVRLGELGIGSC